MILNNRSRKWYYPAADACVSLPQQRTTQEGAHEKSSFCRRDVHDIRRSIARAFRRGEGAEG